MKTLQEYGITFTRGEPTAPGTYKTLCPECKNSRKSKNKNDQPLSVTIEGGGAFVFRCHNCEWTGGYRGDDDSQRDYQPRREYKKPKPLNEATVTNQTDAFYSWFKKVRGFSKETVDQFNIHKTEHFFPGPGETLSCIAFPYTKDGELVNVKYRTNDKQFAQEGKAERTLFNIDRVKARFESPTVTNHGNGTYGMSGNWTVDENPPKTVIFVEGEMDVLALYECGFANVVSLPDGAPKEAKFDPDDKRFHALQAHEWLADAEKVIIAVDTDGPGAALAQELAHRFGKDRCWRVEWPSLNDCDSKDANESLIDHGPEATAECVKLATPYPIDGIYLVDDYRDEVLDIYHGRTQQPISTGFPKLDNIYKLMPGTFHVVTGIPNHGKSTFVDQLAVKVAQNEGWKFGVFSPEHSNAQHIRRFSEKVVEKPFDVGPTPRMVEAELNNAMDFLGKHFFAIESKDTTPDIDWILEKAKALCFRHGINGLIIDPYNEINAARKGGKREDEHIRDLISICKQFCRRHNIVIWMVAHPSKMHRGDDGEYKPPTMYDISGAAHWYNMADAGLTIHRDFDAGETRVMATKIREQGLYGEIGEQKFRFNQAKRVYEELAGSNYQMPYTE